MTSWSGRNAASSVEAVATLPTARSRRRKPLIISHASSAPAHAASVTARFAGAPSRRRDVRTFAHRARRVSFAGNGAGAEMAEMVMISFPWLSKRPRLMRCVRGIFFRIPEPTRCSQGPKVPCSVDLEEQRVHSRDRQQAGKPQTEKGPDRKMKRAEKGSGAHPQHARSAPNPPIRP